ncbi:MAG: DeoR/GlpR transcriptional regulator [Erysipelotrichaceae bacterium]|nr:DeoR/GlpR transcriptional regulator [Erysipelotrichaceae bacterium]MBR2702375.1 DeoR/GlpR transcriptional regulator [Erysipelotrichaceae bacterium]
MNTIARRQRILQELQEKGNVSIVDMAETIGVSSMTIRRDLKKLSAEGLVTLEYGGAALNSGSLFEYNMAMKEREHSSEKVRIARKCLEYINEGDSIYIDSGTTPAELAKLIGNKRNIVVLSHSLLVANILSKYPNVKFIMCPGVFRERSMAYMGQMTDEFVSRFKIDKFFLSIEGIDVDSGVSVPDYTDGETKRNILLNSDVIIVMVDSSKFGKKFFYNIANVQSLDAVVTDENVDPEYVRILKSHNVRVDLV